MTIPSEVTQWRPRAYVRVISIGVVRRGDDLLVAPVYASDGQVKGWRPLGGGVELGETAAAALKREFWEELNREARITSEPFVFENIYQHEGATGHEVVFAFAAEVDGLGREPPVMVEGELAVPTAWVPLGVFLAGDQELYPAGLAELVEERF